MIFSSLWKSLFLSFSLIPSHLHTSFHLLVFLSAPSSSRSGYGRALSNSSLLLSFFPSVEHERDLFHPQPYWKEFRFDLTPLPQGETVTAAEFRIYKTLTMGQRANRTLHISVYEIQREKRHRSCSNLSKCMCFIKQLSI